jgi:hypothetical protein
VHDLQARRDIVCRKERTIAVWLNMSEWQRRLQSTLQAWSDAAIQVELAKVPEVGRTFGNYPDRSTPAVTDGKSQ